MIGPEAHGAWKELEIRLRPYVARRLESPADVDDVVQDVFVRLHRGLGGLRDRERFGPWVYRIASNAVTDHLRGRARRPVAEAKELVAPRERDDDLERELVSCIAYFVSCLPSPYREAITLTELEGLTQTEAARMVGISVSGMKSRVQRGRARLRAMFEACCEIALDARGRVMRCDPRAPEQIPACLRGVLDLET